MRIPYSLKVTRDELIKQAWETRRYTLDDIGKMFRLGTTQVFDILKALKNEKQTNPIRKNFK